MPCLTNINSSIQTHVCLIASEIHSKAPLKWKSNHHNPNILFEDATTKEEKHWPLRVPSEYPMPGFQPFQEKTCGYYNNQTQRTKSSSRVSIKGELIPCINQINKNQLYSSMPSIEHDPHINQIKWNLHIEKLRMANKWIPSQRGVKLDETLQLSLFTRHPSKHHHYPFSPSSSFLPSPVIPTPKSPHCALSLFLQFHLRLDELTSLSDISFCCK